MLWIAYVRQQTGRVEEMLLPCRQMSRKLHFIYLFNVLTYCTSSKVANLVSGQTVAEAKVSLSCSKTATQLDP